MSCDDVTSTFFAVVVAEIKTNVHEMFSKMFLII